MNRIIGINGKPVRVSPKKLPSTKKEVKKTLEWLVDRRSAFSKQLTEHFKVIPDEQKEEIAMFDLAIKLLKKK
jgi:hypothetical protein